MSYLINIVFLSVHEQAQTESSTLKELFNCLIPPKKQFDKLQETSRFVDAVQIQW